MKRVAGCLLTAAVVFSVTTSAFASKAPIQNEIYNKPIGQIIHPKHVESLIEKEEVAKIKALYEADIAKLEESLKALHEEIKALGKVKPVDEEAMAELKKEDKELHDKLKAKRDELNKAIERAKMVLRYGEEATTQIETAQAKFAAEESKIKERIEAIKAEIAALLAAETVDEDAVAKLREEEKALHDELKTKRDELKNQIDRIKLIAEYGKDVIVQIEEQQALFEKKIIALEEKKNEVKAKLKELRAAKPVDKDAVEELMKEEKILNDQIRLEKETLANIINEILDAAIAN